MYGASTSDSPCAFISDVFMSWTSLAMSDPETRSSVWPASSLMLHKRWRTISKVTGSTRVGSVDARDASWTIAGSALLGDGAQPRHDLRPHGVDVVAGVVVRGFAISAADGVQDLLVFSERPQRSLA